MTNTASDRPASARLLLAALGAYALAHLFNNTVLELDVPRRALAALQAWSGGWIEPVLVRSQVVLAAFLLVVVGFGKRRPAELGLRSAQLGPGLATFAAAWCALQLVLVGAGLVQGRDLALHRAWAAGVPVVLGGVLTQALGHALVEDTAFRGFFLPELRARLAKTAAALAPFAALALALLGSALLFGLAHLPTRALVKGSGLAALLREQGQFLSAGLALGLAFVLTRNLFTVVGLHVLLNDPAPLVDAPPALLRGAVLCVFAGVLVLTLVRSLRRRAQPDAQTDQARRAA